ncbi:MAG: BON domain-containing protein [Rhizobiaceae bacterium]|nr:BON domain-containing protein [Rhizobiaceae bacterium]
MVFKAATFHGVQPNFEGGMNRRSQLESAVANALAVAGGVDATDVVVTAAGQEIRLDGSVATPEEIERATMIASSVFGVRLVRNRIMVG